MKTSAKQSSARTKKVNARALSLHPNTPAEELRRLFEERAQHRYLVQNPNLPYDLLWKLAEEYPKQAFENPAFALLCLEQPEQLQNISSKLALQFTSIPETPAFVLQLLAKHPSMYVLEEVSRHKNTQPETLLFLVRRGLISPSLAHHQNATEPILRRLLLQESPSVRVLAAKHPKAPKPLIESLRRAGFSASLEREPKQLGLLSSELYSVFLSESEYLCSLIAASPFTPEPILVKLSQHPSKQVRCAAAQNTMMPVEGAEFLAEDPEESVRVALAQSPGVPATLLRRAALDSSAKVRTAAARNRCASQEVLRLLARDIEAQIRAAAVSHPNCPKELSRW